MLRLWNITINIDFWVTLCRVILINMNMNLKHHISPVIKFLISLCTFFSYYKNKVLKWSTFGLFAISIAFIFYVPTNKLGKILFAVFLVCLVIKEFFQMRDSENLNNTVAFLRTNQEKIIATNIERYKKDLLTAILDYMGKFYNLKGGTRFTIFRLENLDGRDCLKAYHRINFGSPPGIPTEHPPFFYKGCGLPGLAWENAWDKDSLSELIDAIQLGKLTDDLLQNQTELKEYFKDKFNATDAIFDSLGDDKYKIKSYLSIGVIGHKTQISYVLSIDSIKSDAFDDFDTFKKAKQTTAKIEETIIKQRRIEVRGEKDDDSVIRPDELGNLGLPITDNAIDPALPITKIDLPIELQEIFGSGEDLFKRLSESNISSIVSQYNEVLKKTGTLAPEYDYILFNFGLLLKLIEIVLNMGYSYNNQV